MQTTDFFQSPSNIRVANQLRLVSLLLDGPASISDLAKKMGVAFTSVVRIVNEVTKSGIATATQTIKEPKGKRGPKPVYVKLNEEIGVICAIDMAGMDTVIALGDISNHIVVTDRIKNVDRINEDLLKEITLRIKKLLASPAVKGRPLLGICISCNGKIDKDTNAFYYVLRVDDYEHLNLRDYFRSCFNVDVNVFNDVHLGLVGEKMFGVIPNDSQDVLFAFLDEAVGFSLILNGDLYGGAHGFAGEAADIKPIDEFSKNKLVISFSDVQDIRSNIKKAIKDRPNHPLYGVETYNFDEIVELYKQGEPIVGKIVDDSAKINAIRFLSIAELLDLQYIVINGKILDFGERYLNLLVSSFKNYDKLRCQTTFLFSPLKNTAALKGALYEGNNLFLLKLFGEMAKTRANMPEYDVSKVFGNNI